MRKRPTDTLALVELLGRRIQLHAATFEDSDAKRRILEFPRQRDAGGAGADDTDFGLDDRARRNRTCVDNHWRYPSETIPWRRHPGGGGPQTDAGDSAKPASGSVTAVARGARPSPARTGIT